MLLNEGFGANRAGPLAICGAGTDAFAPRVEAMLEETEMELQEIIRKAIEIGRRTGFITFDQINELCPRDIEPEVVEALFMALRDEGIQVADDDR